MARLKLKQVLSSLSYNESTEELILSGSTAQNSFIVSGSVKIEDNSTVSGSLTIKEYDTFGDKNTPNTIDLGSY